MSWQNIKSHFGAPYFLNDNIYNKTVCCKTVDLSKKVNSDIKHFIVSVLIVGLQEGTC